VVRKAIIAVESATLELHIFVSSCEVALGCGALRRRITTSGENEWPCGEVADEVSSTDARDSIAWDWALRPGFR